MTIVPLEEARANLSERIGKLVPSEELLITRDNQPVARLIGLTAETPHPAPGRYRGILTIYPRRR